MSPLATSATKPEWEAGVEAAERACAAVEALRDPTVAKISAGATAADRKHDQSVNAKLFPAMERGDVAGAHAALLLADKYVRIPLEAREKIGAYVSKRTATTPAIENPGSDEIGDIARATNGIRDRLHGSVFAYNGMRDRLATLIGEVAAVAEESSASAEQVTATTQETSARPRRSPPPPRISPTQPTASTASSAPSVSKAS